MKRHLLYGLLCVLFIGASSWISYKIIHHGKLYDKQRKEYTDLLNFNERLLNYKEWIYGKSEWEEKKEKAEDIANIGRAELERSVHFSIYFIAIALVFILLTVLTYYNSSKLWQGLSCSLVVVAAV